MNRYFTAGCSLLAALLFSACSSTRVAEPVPASPAPDEVSTPVAVVEPVTVSDEELQATTLQIVAGLDEQNLVAPVKNKYAKRIARLTARLANEDDLSLNFKVYLSTDVNVFATPDGSIRFYSGLLDLLNDDEVFSVLGHVIGHVKLGHSLEVARAAYSSSYAGRVATPEGGLSARALAEVSERFLGSAYSPDQESNADIYSVKFLKRHHHRQGSAVWTLRKLAKLEGTDKGGSNSLLASHPASGERANELRSLIAPEKKGLGKRRAAQKAEKKP
jgi:putative metalloprotease